MVDVLGLILAVAVTGANVQDRDGGQLVLKGLKDRFPRLARVWADGVYAGRLVEWAEKTAQFVLDIVCKPRGQIGFSVLPWRWIVERTFAWLGNYRRLARDYEINPRTSEAWIKRFWCKLLKGSVSCDNCRDDGTDLGTRSVQGTAL